MSLPQLIDALVDLAIPTTSNLSSGASALESLPLECIQTILGNLSDDCHALYALLLVNKAWFHMVLPFLYKSPMTLIDSTWPKLSSYSQVLKKEPLASTSASPGLLDRPSSPMAAPRGSFDESRPGLSLSNITSQGGVGGTADSNTFDANGRHGRSLYSNRRTSTTSSNGGGYGGGFGYAPRTHSRSSSHSSTRSMTGDAFLQGRNDAVVQKEQRDRLVKRKKLQVLWVFLNCTLSKEERLAWTSSMQEEEEEEVEEDKDRNSDSSNNSVHSTVIKESTLLSLDLNPDLDINLEYFKPMVDYLSFYTHQSHPGLRFITWKLFPTIEDAITIEWRLISHGPERIRELFLESVQLQDMVPLVSRLETLYKIRTCHESWNIPGSIEFMKLHNEYFGTVRMMELEAYLPENHDTVMSDDIGQLIGQVDHLKVLELSGFEKLQAVLEDIPRGELKVLRLNCGSLSPQDPPSATTFRATEDLSSSHGSIADEVTNGRMTISTFLSQCRQLEELLLKPVDEAMLEWAVQERRDFQAGVPLAPTSPSSASFARPTPQALVPLRIIELSGTDSEHVAMMISQAAEAFQDTLEVIKANSYSYIANRTQKTLSWQFPMPKLRVLKIVGRSNLPFDFRSLQYCPELRILDLSKYSGMRGCQEVGLLNLKYLTKLDYLGLSSFDHLTDSTLRTILGCMPRLKHLRLAIGDTALSTLGSSSIAYTTSGSISASGSGGGKTTGSRAPGMFGGFGGGASGGLGGGASSSSNNSATTGVGSGSDMPYRSPFAAISAASSASASASASASSSTSPAPAPQLPSSPQTQQQQQLQQQPLGTINMIVGQIQNQPFGHHHHHGHHHLHHHSHHHPPAPPPSLSSTPFHSYMSGATTTTGSSIGSTGGVGIGGGMSSSSNSSVSGMGGGGCGEMASSARSTSSSLMDRFHLENTYLSLEGILDAIDGLSEDKDKNQLDKLSIVLGKLDFEEHYRRLELYNQQYQDLEISVYRYAHAV